MLDIIYEDKDILVVRKPSGTAVQTKNFGQKDLESMIKAEYGKKTGSTYLGIVHRLDQPVEGVMVFALNKKAAASLSSQAAGTGMQKRYLAVVEYTDMEKTGDLTDWLLRDGRTNTSSVVKAGTKDAKEASLSYTIKEVQAPYALAEVLLHTGRHHQIRVQMSNAGMPLYADAKYGQAVRGAQIGLCACELELIHPSSGEKMTFTCTPKNPVFGRFQTLPT